MARLRALVARRSRFTTIETTSPRTASIIFASPPRVEPATASPPTESAPPAAAEAESAEPTPPPATPTTIALPTPVRLPASVATRITRAPHFGSDRAHVLQRTVRYLDAHILDKNLKQTLSAAGYTKFIHVVCATPARLPPVVAAMPAAISQIDAAVHQLLGVSWDAARAALNLPPLARPLVSLLYEQRLIARLDAAGYTTLGMLVLMQPEIIAQRHLVGTQARAEVENAVFDALGYRWEDARTRVFELPPAAPAAYTPFAADYLPLAWLDLPANIDATLADNDIRTVGALLGLPPATVASLFPAATSPIAALENAIMQRCQRTWATAAAELAALVQQPHPFANPAIDIAGRLPLADRPLATLPLSERTHKRFAPFSSVRQLIATPLRQLRQQGSADDVNNVVRSVEALYGLPWYVIATLNDAPGTWLGDARQPGGNLPAAESPTVAAVAATAPDDDTPPPPIDTAAAAPPVLLEAAPAADAAAAPAPDDSGAPLEAALVQDVTAVMPAPDVPATAAVAPAADRDIAQALLNTPVGRLLADEQLSTTIERRGYSTLGLLLHNHKAELDAKLRLRSNQVATIVSAVEMFTGRPWSEARSQLLRVAGADPIPYAPAVADYLPLARLDLNTRMYNALFRSGHVTVAAVIRLTPEELQAVRNVGPKGAEEIAHAVQALCGLPWSDARTALVDMAADPVPTVTTAPTVATAPDVETAPDGETAPDVDLEAGGQSEVAATLPPAIDLTAVPIPPLPTLEAQIDGWLSSLTARQRQIVQQRSGLNRQSATLLEIGAELGLSRERVRQLERTSLVQLAKSSLSVAPTIQLLHWCAREHGGIFGSDQWQLALAHFGVVTGDIDAWQLAVTLANVRPEFTIYDKALIATADFPVSHLPSLNQGILAVFERIYRPLAPHVLLDELLSTESPHTLDQAVIAAYLRVTPRLIAVEAGLLPANWQNRRTHVIVQTLFECEAPQHFEELTALVNTRFAADNQMTSNNVHGYLDRRRDLFVRVGHGIYGLQEWGLPDDGSLPNAVERVLREAGQPMHITLLIDRVLETWRVRPESITAAIYQDERFIALGNGVHAIEAVRHAPPLLPPDNAAPPATADAAATPAPAEVAPPPTDDAAPPDSFDAPLAHDAQTAIPPGRAGDTADDDPMQALPKAPGTAPLPSALPPAADSTPHTPTASTQMIKPKPDTRQQRPPRAALLPDERRRFSDALRTIENDLRAQIRNITWVGELDISASTFDAYCELARRYALRQVSVKPENLPPLFFVTLMVFCARYDESGERSFWLPFARLVWQLNEASPWFQNQCRERFAEATDYLMRHTDLRFQRPREGDVVLPVYRHALLPAYLQAEFADWLADKWRELVDLPAEALMGHIATSRSVEHLPRRLRTFLTDNDRRAAAETLVLQMARLTSLFIRDQLPEAVLEAQISSPLARDVWRVILTRLQAETATRRATRGETARQQWLWSLDTHQLSLRLENVTTDGRPEILHWGNADGTAGRRDIYEQVVPLRAGGWWLDGAELEADRLDGTLELRDINNHVLSELRVAPLHVEHALFFTLRDGAEAGRLRSAERAGGRDAAVWLAEGVTLVDAARQPIAARQTLPVPAPLRHGSAGIYALPAVFGYQHGGKPLWQMPATAVRQLQVELQGAQIAGLAAEAGRVFSSTQLTLTLHNLPARWQHGVALIIRSGAQIKRVPLQTLPAGNGGDADADTLYALAIDLQPHLPARSGRFALQLWRGLERLLDDDLLFYVLPNVVVQGPDPARVYWPGEPPHARLRGITPDQIVQPDGRDAQQPRYQVTPEEGAVQVTWRQLRPLLGLTLLIGDQHIPLSWRVGVMSTWLEPALARPSAADLAGARLHIIGPANREQFPNQDVQWCHLRAGSSEERRYNLKDGHAVIELRVDPLLQMVREQRKTAVPITIRMRDKSWEVLTVRRRPDVTGLKVVAGAGNHLAINVEMAKPGAWEDTFTLAIISNARQETVQQVQLSPLTIRESVPHSLPPGAYTARLIHNGAVLAQSDFYVTAEASAAAPPPAPPAVTRAEQPPPSAVAPATLATPARSLTASDRQRLNHFLVDETSGIVPPELQHAFVETLLSAPHALTPHRLLQLATLRADTLATFDRETLAALWPWLARLPDLHTPAWLDTNGPAAIEGHSYLPAWAVTNRLLPFKWYMRQETVLDVYPLYAADRLRRGYGWARRSVEGNEARRIQDLYARWWHAEEDRYHLVLGIPDRLPIDKATDDGAVWMLERCEVCGRFFGDHGGVREQEHNPYFVEHAKRCAGRKLIYTTATHPFMVRLDSIFRKELPPHADGPENYLDKRFKIDLLDGKIDRAPRDATPLSAPHYRVALYNGYRRWQQNPPAMLRFEAERKRLEKTHYATHWQAVPESRVQNAFLRLYKLLNTRGDNPALHFDADVLALANTLRALAHQPKNADGAPLHTLANMTAVANTLAPELLLWALTWVELFHIHSHD